MLKQTRIDQFYKKFCFANVFFSEKIISDNLQLAINHLNFVRQGNIVLNEFDLQKIYSDNIFNFSYAIACSNSQKFKLKDIQFPHEKNADYLLMIVMYIFSNPVNCGYFLKNELDLIFSLFTLSPKSQMLFVRLLKRKSVCYRASKIKYPEIADNLNPFFFDLIQNGFCKSDLESTNIIILLNMLQLQEIRSICKTLKINHLESKRVLIERLLKYGTTSKSLFIGSKSPKSVLRSMALFFLQTCIYLPKDIINLFNRLLTLFCPVQDPSENISDLFIMLTKIEEGLLLYPFILHKEAFPVFKNRIHLIDFVNSKNLLKDILMAIQKKKWDEVRNLGHLALKYLLETKIIDKKTSLPLHVEKFMPEYIWIKVLSKSVEAFKKTPETIIQAMNILKTLISYKHFFENRQGQWYNELVLIKMHYQKDLESSAALILHTLKQKILTEVDVLNLIKKLKNLEKRKTGISKKTKILIKKEINSFISPKFTTKSIRMNMANRIKHKGKSTWSININNENYYGTIEMVVLQYYISKENFHEGLHCEGSLPITLFVVCFWEEIYNDLVPSSFISYYQDAPLDLFTAEFFINRKQFIEKKIKFIHELNLDLFAHWMQERYSNYSKYKSLMPNNLFKNHQQFKEMVTCLGMNTVIGICEKLISNFRLWRSGFPDLIMWNAVTLKNKIVEVKGPTDSLSEKQKLWLQYLDNLGIDIELCRVED
ncbi:PREDICTED: fanconi-associated nuclease 1-like [Ceratosolen solmsi marchali]|uniref:Fanconi-associated nuclease n=1 Tax=Ceratosolen solmsi marchali TaxID=326594 RepID=A0AAJ6VM77_9HYME|nr:PREDICTED: fanconi-associated nuclease 1-like [Ceratosolen solmsi marchali]